MVVSRTNTPAAVHAIRSDVLVPAFVGILGFCVHLAPLLALRHPIVQGVMPLDPFVYNNYSHKLTGLTFSFHFVSIYTFQVTSGKVVWELISISAIHEHSIFGHFEGLPLKPDHEMLVFIFTDIVNSQMTTWRFECVWLHDILNVCPWLQIVVLYQWGQWESNYSNKSLLES